MIEKDTAFIEVEKNKKRIEELIEKAGFEIILNLADGITKAIPLLLHELPTIISDAVTTLLEYAPQMVDAGIGLIDALITGVMDAGGQLLERLPELIGMAVETIATELPKILESGKNLILKLIYFTPH